MMTDENEILRLYEEVEAYRRKRDPSTVDTLPRELIEVLQEHRAQQEELRQVERQAEEDRKHLEVWRGHQRARRDYACAQFHQQHRDSIRRAETAEREANRPTEEPR